MTAKGLCEVVEWAGRRMGSRHQHVFESYRGQGQSVYSA